MDLTATLARSASLQRRGDPHAAASLLEQSLQGAVGDAERKALLFAQLELLHDWLGTGARQLVPVLQQLQQLVPDDPRVLTAAGVQASLEARNLLAVDPASGARYLREAIETLERAVALPGAHPDAWGSLGGARKKLAEATPRGPARQALFVKMLEAYRQGWESDPLLPHPYPLLNYLEQRAILDHGSLVRDPAEAGALDRALRFRKQQHDRQLDRPWAAFDLARGRHYLEPDVPRFLRGLTQACQETLDLAISSRDRHPIRTTQRSLAALHAAAVPLEGLEQAIGLLTAWSSAAVWRPAATSTHAEADGDAQARIVGALVALQRSSDLHLSEARLQWSDADERRFETSMPALRKSFETMDQKVLRAAWKRLGSDGVKALLGAVGIPGVALDVAWDVVAD